MSLSLWMRTLARVRVLPPTEQAALAVELQRTGDTALASRLAASNLRLVVAIAKRFTRREAELDELVACGNVGLAEAMRRFDPDKKLSFPSFASIWIRAAILDHVRTSKLPVRLGTRAARRVFWGLERARRELGHDGVAPSAEAIARHLDVPLDEVTSLAPIIDRAAASAGGVIPYDTLGAEERTIAEHEDSPEAAALDRETAERRHAALEHYRAQLDARERLIWDRRIIAEDGALLHELGAELGLSKERTRQIESGIKRRLRDWLLSHDGLDLLAAG